MYGEIVKVDIGHGVLIDVFVPCVPNMLQDELQEIAKKKIKRVFEDNLQV